jgi:hypothetical protein
MELSGDEIAGFRLCKHQPDPLYRVASVGAEFVRQDAA